MEVKCYASSRIRQRKSVPAYINKNRAGWVITGPGVEIQVTPKIATAIGVVIASASCGRSIIAGGAFMPHNITVRLRRDSSG